MHPFTKTRFFGLSVEVRSISDSDSVSAASSILCFTSASDILRPHTLNRLFSLAKFSCDSVGDFDGSPSSSFLGPVGELLGEHSGLSKRP